MLEISIFMFQDSLALYIESAYPWEFQILYAIFICIYICIPNTHGNFQHMPSLYDIYMQFPMPSLYLQCFLVHCAQSTWSLHIFHLILHCIGSNPPPCFRQSAPIEDIKIICWFGSRHDWVGQKPGPCLSTVHLFWPTSGWDAINPVLKVLVYCRSLNSWIPGINNSIFPGNWLGWLPVFMEMITNIKPIKFPWKQFVKWAVQKSWNRSSRWTDISYHLQEIVVYLHLYKIHILFD